VKINAGRAGLEPRTPAGRANKRSIFSVFSRIKNCDALLSCHEQKASNTKQNLDNVFAYHQAKTVDMAIVVPGDIVEDLSCVSSSPRLML